MTELESVLADLARRLEKAEIPYMVIGGMANAVWGIPRATLNIDVTALLEASRAEEVLCLLGENHKRAAEEVVNPIKKPKRGCKKSKSETSGTLNLFPEET